MLRTNAAIVCTCLLLALGGCADCFTTRPAPSIKRHTAAAVPPKPDLSIVERAKSAQDSRCGQRHVDRGQGTLKETEEQKGDRDDRCSELHRNDYVR
jgi:hypothetical protein